MSCLFCETDPYCFCKKRKNQARYTWLTVLLLQLDIYRAKHPDEDLNAWHLARTNAIAEKRIIKTRLIFSTSKKLKKLKITK